MMQPEHDGRRYHFPGGDPLKSGWQALRWALTRRPARWPRQLPNPPQDPVVERVTGDAMRVSFINHATVLIQTQALNILTDPVFSRRVSPSRFAGPARHRAPGLLMGQLPPIDVILISHCHYDHLDLHSLAQLHQAHAPVVLAPLNNAPIIAKTGIANTHELTWWQSLVLDDACRITLVPARHWSSRSISDANRALWGGFVIGTPGGAIYFAGDTGLGDGAHFQQALDAHGPFRLALLPIGAYEPRWFMQPQHMNPFEAVRAFDLLQARHAIAIHFGTFQLTDEPHDAPELALAEALNSHDDASIVERFRLLGNGQAWDIPAMTHM